MNKKFCYECSDLIDCSCKVIRVLRTGQKGQVFCSDSCLRSSLDLSHLAPKELKN